MEEKDRFVRRVCDALAECEPERWGDLSSEPVRYVANREGTLEFLVHGGRALDVTGDSLTAMMGALRSLLTSSERTVEEAVAMRAVDPGAPLSSGHGDGLERDEEWGRRIAVGYTNGAIASVLESHGQPVTRANVEAFAERLFDYMRDQGYLLDLDEVMMEARLPDVDMGWPEK